MPPEQKMQMPGAFGGLMRYDEEYNSRFMITPMQVMIFVVVVIVLVLILKIFFPVASPIVNPTNIPAPVQGIVLTIFGRWIR
jgi:preprotein translocase subunit Sec61beta